VAEPVIRQIHGGHGRRFPTLHGRLGRDCHDVMPSP
jgi:hypothetical protein